MQKKTAFMVLNCKQVDLPDADCIRIGQEQIQRESSAKLLGIKCEDNQQWKEPVNQLNAQIKIIDAVYHL